MPFGGWESLERSSLLKVAKDFFLDTIVAVKKKIVLFPFYYIMNIAQS